MKVKLTIVESKCRMGFYKNGDEFIVEEKCPPICMELWNQIYPYVFTLLNGGTLDYGNTLGKCFDYRCPDDDRVLVHGEVIED